MMKRVKKRPGFDTSRAAFRIHRSPPLCWCDGFSVCVDGAGRIGSNGAAHLFFAALRSRPAEDRKQTGDLEIGVCYRVSTGSPTAHLTKSIARVSRLLLFYGPDRESNDVRSSSGDSFRLDVID